MNVWQRVDAKTRVVGVCGVGAVVKPSPNPGLVPFRKHDFQQWRGDSIRALEAEPERRAVELEVARVRVCLLVFGKWLIEHEHPVDAELVDGAVVPRKKDVVDRVRKATTPRGRAGEYAFQGLLQSKLGQGSRVAGRKQVLTRRLADVEVHGSLKRAIGPRQVAPPVIPYDWSGRPLDGYLRTGDVDAGPVHTLFDESATAAAAATAATSVVVRRVGLPDGHTIDKHAEHESLDNDRVAHARLSLEDEHADHPHHVVVKMEG
mmetsp:Transcript_13483/g.43007  ORF Transcript_13483/g.43007 Transcript_13483/m.43007 type:complete len:262 (-) Transcript_13483:864-1649(-)